MQEQEDPERAGDPGGEQDRPGAGEDARRRRRGGPSTAARKRSTDVGSRDPIRPWSRAASAIPADAAASPPTTVQRAQPGSGRKNADTAPTPAKAIISSRCAQRRLPPARGRPGQRLPAETRSTATFEPSPSRPGSTVSRKEPIALAA
jgi:hypothetical protein